MCFPIYFVLHIATYSTIRIIIFLFSDTFSDPLSCDTLAGNDSISTLDAQSDITAPAAQRPLRLDILPPPPNNHPTRRSPLVSCCWSSSNCIVYYFFCITSQKLVVDRTHAHSFAIYTFSINCS